MPARRRGDDKANRPSSPPRSGASVSPSGRPRRRASSAGRRRAGPQRGQQRREARRHRRGSPAPRPPARGAARRASATARAAPVAIRSSVPGLPGTASSAAPELRARARAVMSAPDAKPRLDHQHRLGQRGDDPVARRELPAARRRPGRVLGDAGRPRAAIVGEQRGVAIGIDDVDAAAEHGERRAARVERAPVRGRVDPERAARDDREALPRGRRRELAREPARRHARRPRAPTIARRRSVAAGQPSDVPERLRPAEASSPTRPESRPHLEGGGRGSSDGGRWDNGALVGRQRPQLWAHEPSIVSRC